MARVGKEKNRQQKLYFLCVAFCLFFCVFSGCGQAKGQTGKQEGNPADPVGTEVPTQESDWTAGFKPAGGGEQSANSAGNPTPKPTPEPTKAPDGEGGRSVLESIMARMEYPTQIPPRQFTPTKEQTELVLWLPYDENDSRMYGRKWGKETTVDRHILAELNHILQERGYSFYLTLRVEPEPVKLLPNGMTKREPNKLCEWQEVLDAGEQVDLILIADNEDRVIRSYTYGKPGVVQAIQGGYLLPFSEYPETEAKKRLLAAYPKTYWELTSFGGENYGISDEMFRWQVYTDYLFLNLDAAEQAGIELPERLDVTQLDELLAAAAAAGLPGIYFPDATQYYPGVSRLSCDLYVKCGQDGSKTIINPFRDEECIACWDALRRYKKNGWYARVPSLKGEIPLVLEYPLTAAQAAGNGDWYKLEGDRFFVKTEDEKWHSARVKVYEKKKAGIREEGALGTLLGIASTTKHPEEAVELLSLLQSDEEIVQLLRYGLENVHYQIGEDGLEDVTTSYLMLFYEGIGVWREDGEFWATMFTEQDELPEGLEPVAHASGCSNRTMTIPGKGSYGNLVLPVALDAVAGRKNGAEEIYRELEEVPWIPYLGDFTEEQWEIREACKDILYENRDGAFVEYYFDWSGENPKRPEYGKELERLQRELEKAGYDRLVAEMNQKLGASGK